MKDLPTKILITLLIGAPVTGLLLAFQSPKKVHGTKVESTEIIERGRYLVNFGGCNDCHTPWKMTDKGPQPDLSLLLSGHPESAKLPPPPKAENSPWFASTAGMTAWAGPWGISYAANLTPDNNTGLGIWTEEMFIKAMRTGKHMSAGRDILPPMPWQAVAGLNDDDIKAIYAYLRSIPAIQNRVPEPVPPTGVSAIGE